MPSTIKSIIAEARDEKAFGGGQASNVVRFFLREQTKGRSQIYIDSKAVHSVLSGLTGRESSKRDYAFYARMNMNSSRSFRAVLQFCKAVVSLMCSSTGWTGQKVLGKVLIPRLLLSVDKGDADYEHLRQWMKRAHEKCKKEYRLGFDEYDNQEEAIEKAAPDFASIAIVEGANATGIMDSMVFDGTRLPNIEAHAKALGLLHGLDVALGMGDRLQNPNPANITVNPRTHQLVLIDIDTFLPPFAPRMPDIEEACRWTTQQATTDRRNNEAWTRHAEQWKACPPRLPLQGNYIQSVSGALDEDLDLYLNHLKRNLGEIRTAHTYHQKSVHVMAPTLLRDYWVAMNMGHNRHTFKRAAIETMQAIRAGINAVPSLFHFDVDANDITFSVERLRERVNQWRF